MGDQRQLEEDDLAPLSKAAILLLAMGEDEAAKVLKHLEPREVQKVGAAMSALGRVNTRHIDRVVNHFLETVSGEADCPMGANDYLKGMLVGALGERRGGSMLGRLVGGQRSGLDKLKWMGSRAVVDFIRDEHPQLQAIVLSYLEPAQAAAVLRAFADDRLRGDLLLRVARLGAPDPRASNDSRTRYQQQASRPRAEAGPGLGGPAAVACILSCLEPVAARAAVEAIRERDPELAGNLTDTMGLARPPRPAGRHT